MHVHLHVHSHFTLLGATPSVDELAERAAAEEMSHLALTDTHRLSGAVAFARACRRHAIAPIIGMTVQVMPPEPLAEVAGGAGELQLLAQSPAGYRSLCRLSSLLLTDPTAADGRPLALPASALKEQAAGLLCLSGGRRGWVERLLRQGNRPAAGRAAAWLAGLFGEAAWLALEVALPGDEQIAEAQIELAHRLGIGAVAVQPIYTLLPNDHDRLRLLTAIARNTRLADLPPAALPDGGDRRLALHWPTPEEMGARFARFPAVLAASATLAQTIGPVLPDGRPIWPVLALPDGATPDHALRRLAEAGVRRFAPGSSEPGAVPAEVTARLERELAAIARDGFAPLFLLVAEIVRYAREQEIPVSTRGSVANSLVAYCADITTVDPIRHNLLFERFLNPARASLPDIDLDFCSVRRDDVLHFVRERFGADQVALVATVSTLRIKSAVRETAKAFGVDDQRAGALLKLLPEEWHPDPARRQRLDLAGALAAVSDASLHPLIEAAFSILHQPDHMSIHPGAVIITPGPLTDYVPLQWAPKGFLTTQYEHGDVEAIGLPKMDLLGIRALTVLAEAAGAVRSTVAPAFRLDRIPVDDPLTGALLAQGDTIGVFQCESAGAQRTLRQLKAHTPLDLAIANAFFKPGPYTGGMAQAFIRRYRGEEATSFLHPSLEPILGFTKGVLIFQEQVLRLATEIAGLSWAEADHLRKGMSKFQANEIHALRERFVAGCRRTDGPGLTAAQATTLWEQIVPFAGYGFNQGHATAYADVSYRSAYLRAHYPAQFLAARLATWGGYYYATTYIAEARRLGIAVRPPHINFSGAEFTLVSRRVGEDDKPDVLYMGLGQVRDLRHAAIAAIAAERAQAPFTGVADLAERVALQAKEIANLVACGALDGLGASRAALAAEVEETARGGALQMTLFAAEPPPAESAAQRLLWERQILGFPVSVHPLDVVSLPAGLTPLAQLAAQPGKRLRTAGCKLPGGTGGKGFFLADPGTFVTAVPVRGLASPANWEPVLLTGRWLMDDWGGGSLQVEAIDRFK
jgi:DNA-directed DNA polymerase III PolC